MAQKKSDKQIKYFGTKREKAALAARRSKARAWASKSKPQKQKQKNFTQKHKTRTVRNPVPQVLALTMGNPGGTTKKRAQKTMATSTKKAKKSPVKRNAGATKKKMSFGRKVKRNPGALGSPMDWVKGGVGVLGGVVVTRALPQMVLADKNQGGVGYFANAVVAAGAGWVTHLVFPRDRVLMASVVAGGFAALLARVIGDFTDYGKYLSLTGVGDYMMWNGVAPQRLPDALNSAMVEVPPGWGSAPPEMVMSSSGVPGNGVDLGRRGGIC